VAILKLQTGRALGHRADTHFGTFASRDFAKLLNSKEYSLCGQLYLTAGQTALRPWRQTESPSAKENIESLTP
jgi:hypothetical protein